MRISDWSSDVCSSDLVTTFRPDLRRPFPADLAQRLTGATVTRLSRRAKYGIVSTDRDDHMIFHLGMSGSWRNEGGEAGKHDHQRLETGDGQRLLLNDPRRSEEDTSVLQSLRRRPYGVM